MSGREVLILVRRSGARAPEGLAGREALNWANRPPFDQPTGACRDGPCSAGCGAVNGWPASERRPCPAAVTFSRQFPAPGPSAERALLAREELQAVWNALSSLSPQQRAIFFLRFEEEMPLAQIADLLQVKVGSVKTQLARATGKLREMKEKQWK